jgi:hypothetical protein
MEIFTSQGVSTVEEIKLEKLYGKNGNSLPNLPI